jgi:ABC-type transport system involved in multi-copper enzyme maturation permease subunit
LTTINIGIFILVCVVCVVIGFIISSILSGSAINKLDDEIKNQKILNNRKDQIIDFYKSYNISNKNDTDKERKSK